MSKAATSLNTEAYKRLSEAHSMLTQEQQRLEEAEEKKEIEGEQESLKAKDDWSPEAREAAAEARKGETSSKYEEGEHTPLVKRGKHYQGSNRGGSQLPPPDTRKAGESKTTANMRRSSEAVK